LSSARQRNVNVFFERIIFIRAPRILPYQGGVAAMSLRFPARPPS
jgi:hypothetical protein